MSGKKKSRKALFFTRQQSELTLSKSFSALIVTE